MASKQVLVFSRSKAGVQVLPAMAGSCISAKTLLIKFSASSTASSVRGGGGNQEGKKTGKGEKVKAQRECRNKIKCRLELALYHLPFFLPSGPPPPPTISLPCSILDGHLPISLCGASSLLASSCSDNDLCAFSSSTDCCNKITELKCALHTVSPTPSLPAVYKSLWSYSFLHFDFVPQQIHQRTLVTLLIEEKREGKKGDRKKRRERKGKKEREKKERKKGKKRESKGEEERGQKERERKKGDRKKGRERKGKKEMKKRRERKGE